MIPAALHRFLSTLGKLGPREDRYPIEALHHLDGASTALAVDALIERVERADDPFAARTLAALGAQRSAPAIVALARRRGSAAGGGLAWVAALSLGVPEAVAEVVKVVRTGSVIDRVAALLALRDRRDRALLDATLAALSSPLTVIRVHAFDAWICQHELVDVARVARSPLDTLKRQLLSGLPILWQDAAEEIRSLTTLLRAGGSPEALDLIYRPSTPDAVRRALARNLAQADEPLDMGLIESLAGHDRRALEVILALRAGPGRRDPRVPAVLASLNPRWALDILDEAVEDMTDDQPFSIAVALAMPTLLAAGG